MNLLLGKGMHEDDAFFACIQFSFLFSTTIGPSLSQKEWIFLLPHEMRLHEYVFGVGIVPFEKNLLDQFFLLPVTEFGIGGMCTFSQTDTRYQRYALPLENMEEKILAMLQKDVVESS